MTRKASLEVALITLATFLIWWPWTLTYYLHLWTWHRLSRGELYCRTVISFESYRTNTCKHTLLTNHHANQWWVKMFRWSSSPHPKRHEYHRFSGFCSVHDRDRPTNRSTDRATLSAIRPHLCSTAMRPNKGWLFLMYSNFSIFYSSVEGSIKMRKYFIILCIVNYLQSYFRLLSLASAGSASGVCLWSSLEDFFLPDLLSRILASPWLEQKLCRISLALLVGLGHCGNVTCNWKGFHSLNYLVCILVYARSAFLYAARWRQYKIFTFYLCRAFMYFKFLGDRL